MSQIHEDIKAIRESLKLSIQDMHDKTRISMENIEQIEDGSIFTTDRNLTYVRCFVRTYVRGLKVSEDDSTAALDLHEQGRYDSFLRKKYIAGFAEPSPKTDKDSSLINKGSATEEKPDVSEKTSSTVKAQQSDKENPTPAIRKEKKVLDGSSIGPGYTGQTKIPAPPKSKDVNWSSMNRANPGSGSKKNEIPLPLILGIVAIVALLVAAGFWFTREVAESVTDLTENADLSVNEFSESAPDLLMSDTLDAPVAPNPSLTSAVLPDTLHVVVYAATGNLEPFRVSSDTFENRRPYWVDQGVGMRVSFINELRLSSSLAQMLVIYDDRVITQFHEDSTPTERILRRSQFTNDPTLESFTTSTFPSGVNPPIEIIERPVLQ
ncbi:MAG: helix-turn-helix domain-containing protein [Balneolales bacterium]|nr:helix-turn-helix domain-containing protein [Balneolales bacterium]